jgi:hypothetical protein
VYQGNSLAQGVVQGCEGVEEVVIEFNWTFYHSKRYIVIKHIKNETKKRFSFHCRYRFNINNFLLRREPITSVVIAESGTHS